MATTIAAVTRAEPMPIRGVLRAYWLEAKYDTLQSLRTPAMAIPFLAIPTAVYLLFGVLMASDAQTSSEFGPGIVNYLFVGFCTFAVIMPGIFCGVALALERDGGTLKLKRALPMPGGANLIAKVFSSTVIAAAALTIVVIAALAAGKLTISLAQVLTIWAVLVAGSIPMCAIGFFIGSVTSGAAAPAYSNLLFLPMMWLSGLFIPLPELLRPYVVVWPAFHLSQLALGLAGISEFSFFPPQMAAAVLAGFTVLFGGLAIWRIARHG